MLLDTVGKKGITEKKEKKKHYYKQHTRLETIGPGTKWTRATSRTTIIKPKVNLRYTSTKQGYKDHRGVSYCTYETKGEKRYKSSVRVSRPSCRAIVVLISIQVISQTEISRTRNIDVSFEFSDHPTVSLQL